MRGRCRAGFTLAEVMVALVLTSMVAILAHQVFSAATGQIARLREARLRLDQQSNTQRFLQSAFLSLEIGLDSTDSFSGQANRMSFSAWVPSSDGWVERETVELAQDGDRWIAATRTGARIELAQGVTDLRFDYLMELGEGSGWMPGWESAVSAPLAVRVRLTRGAQADTMVYLIKARG